MQSLKTFRIEFDQPDAVYTPGEIVSGNVIVHLNREKTVRALTLLAKGEAIVTWTEYANNYDHYRKKEKYFNLTIPLVGKEDDKKVHLPIGLNRYSFRIQLPRDIPCSFEHENGYIRYTIKAIIDRPWKFNPGCKAAFTVIPAYDLNVHLQQCTGIFDEVDKNFYHLCCFCDSSMNVHINLPTTGFVPGQWIEVIISLRNTSRIDLERVSAKLEQSLELHIGKKAKRQRKSTVTSMQKLGPFDKYAVIALHLQIPSVPSSNLEFCSIIDLNYNLYITLHVSGMHYNITKKYPILIGTVPLRFVSSASPISPSPQESQSISYTKIMLPEFDIAPNVSPLDSISMNAFPDAPMSYEESCTSKTLNIKDHHDSSHVHGANEPFAPKYPVFKFPTPYPSKKY